MIAATGHNIFVNLIQFSGENTSRKPIKSLSRGVKQRDWLWDSVSGADFLFRYHIRPAL
jgi:hypothetical protein